MFADDLRFCAHCGGHWRIYYNSGSRMCYRVACDNPFCGVSTPWTSVLAVAKAIWNRRLERKPPARGRIPSLTKQRGSSKLRHAIPRSSGAATGGGKRATARKGAHTKESRK